MVPVECGHNWGGWTYNAPDIPMTIGKAHPLGGYFAGNLDDIKILDIAFKSTEFQRNLAIKEDDILMKKIIEKGIKVVKPQTKNLDEFKRMTKVFHESYFNENPHMKKFIL